MRVQHNIEAMNANRQLKITGGSIVKFARNLSSGYRINMAADDAAGLSISEKMRRQVRGLTQGVQNTEDGVSLCQVADGALAEVHDMLQRINELAVKAANGTNSESDRRCINDEVTQLLTEIDRIGDTTKFNEIFIFKGTEKRTMTKTVLGGGAVRPAKPNYVPTPTFDEVSFDCELTNGPFGPNSSGNDLALGVHSTKEGVDKTWNLIYGNGSTSSPKLVGEYTYTPAGGTATTCAFRIDLNSMTSSNYTAEQKTNGEKEWSRTFEYDGGNGLGMKIKQTVTLGAKTDKSQYYTVSYNVTNTSTIGSVKYNLVHHEDTAYNNNDADESYHISGGNRIEKSTIYTKNDAIANGINTSSINSGSQVVVKGANAVPNDFTIILNSNGKPMALSFTENIKIDDIPSGSVKADTLIVGNFSYVGELDEYTTETMQWILGSDMQGLDIGFSLIWSGQTLAGGASSTYSFRQGMVKTEDDPNIPKDVEKIPTVDISPTADLKPVEVKKDYMGGDRQLWIQSGCDAGDGLVLHSIAMNTGALDIDDISTMTEKLSDDAIDRVSKALEEISRQRSRFGAYQNRLEHTIANEDNIVENTTAAESKIRDTDMADEMVRYSNKNIIMQVGQSMLAQANQSKQGVLSLIAS